MDLSARTSNSFINASQNQLVNNVSRSETIRFGRPWCRQYSLRKVVASSLAVIFFKGIKCANLEKRSTITQILLYPRTSGKSVMKSIEMSVKGAYGISSGLRVPNFACRGVLLR